MSKVLIIDDQENEFEQLSNAFQGSDYDAVWAKNYLQALNILNKNNNIDLVVLDQVFEDPEIEILLREDLDVISFAPEEGERQIDRDSLKQRQGSLILQKLQQNFERLPPVVVASNYPIGDCLFSASGISTYSSKEALLETPTRQRLLDQIFNPAVVQIESILTRYSLKIDRLALERLCSNVEHWGDSSTSILEKFAEYIVEQNFDRVAVEQVWQFERQPELYREFWEEAAFQRNFYKRYIENLGKRRYEENEFFDIFTNTTYNNNYIVVIKPEYFYHVEKDEEKRAYEKFSEKMAQTGIWLKEHIATLRQLPQGIGRLPDRLRYFRYDHSLRYTGSFNNDLRTKWLRLSNDDNWKRAIEELYDSDRQRSNQNKGLHLPYFLSVNDNVNDNWVPMFRELGENAPFMPVHHLVWFKVGINLDNFVSWKNFCDQAGHRKMELFPSLMERTKILGKVDADICRVHEENLWIRQDGDNISLAIIPFAFEELFHRDAKNHVLQKLGNTPQEQVYWLLYRFLRGRRPDQNGLKRQDVQNYLLAIQRHQTVQERFGSFFATAEGRNSHVFYKRLGNNLSMKVQEETLEFRQKFFIEGTPCRHRIDESIHIIDSILVFMAEFENQLLRFENLDFQSMFRLDKCRLDEENDNQKDLIFQGCSFNGYVHIRDCHGFGLVFKNCKFGAKSRLFIHGSELTQVRFESCEAKNYLDRNGKNLDIVEIINSRIDKVHIENSSFNGPVVCHKTIVEDDVAITDSTFTHGLRWRAAMKSGGCITGCCFEEDGFRFEPVEVGGSLKFGNFVNSQLKIQNLALSTPLFLIGEFERLLLGPGLKTQDIHASGVKASSLTISDAQFFGEVSFRKAFFDTTQVDSEKAVIFHNRADFTGAKFGQDFSFSGVVFEKEANFHDCAFSSSGIDFSRCRFGNLDISAIKTSHFLNFNKANIEYLTIDNPEILLNSLELRENEVHKSDLQKQKALWQEMFWDASMFEQNMLRRNAPDDADRFFCKSKQYYYRSKGKKKTEKFFYLLWEHGTSLTKLLLWMAVVCIVATIFLGGNSPLLYAISLLGGDPPNIGNTAGFYTKIGTGAALIVQILLLNLFFAALVRKYLRS